MALTVNDKADERIGRRDFLALASAVGLRERAAASVIDRLLAALPAWRSRLPELPFDDRAVHKLGRAIDYRAGRLV